MFRFHQGHIAKLAIKKEKTGGFGKQMLTFARDITANRETSQNRQGHFLTNVLQVKFTECLFKVIWSLTVLSKC